MRVEEIEIDERGALVFTMTQHVRLGMDRLEALRALRDGSELDDSIQRAVATAARPVEMLILRGESDDGSGSWRFDEALDTQDCEELGYHLLRAQMPMYRELASQGVHLCVKVEWGPREMGGLDEGRRRLLREIEQAADAPSLSSAERARHEVDAWILRTFSYWLLSSLEDSRAFLARSLERAAARRVQVERLLTEAGAS